MEFRGEGDAVKQVLFYGAQYGYGNMIFRLRLAWAIHLLESCESVSVSAACAAAWMPKHEQDEWASFANKVGLAGTINLMKQRMTGFGG